MLELLLKSRKFMFGAFIFLALVILGAVVSLFVGDPLYMNLDIMNQSPNAEHILGTTETGQDIFAQLCYGIGNSMIVGFIAGGLGTGIAVLVGALGPYKGGILDKISNMTTNLVIVIPIMPLFIIIAAVVENLDLVTIGLILGATSWPWAARSIRSQVLTLREREFINLARLSGQRSPDIVVKEVLPNMLAYVMMVFVIITGGAILAEAALSMIGISETATITLGYMLFWVQHGSTAAHWWDHWWWFIPPGLVLTIMLTAIFVMHAGLDEVFNPRLREV